MSNPHFHAPNIKMQALNISASHTSNSHRTLLPMYLYLIPFVYIHLLFNMDLSQNKNLASMDTGG